VSYIDLSNIPTSASYSSYTILLAIPDSLAYYICQTIWYILKSSVR